MTAEERETSKFKMAAKSHGLIMECAYFGNVILGGGKFLSIANHQSLQTIQLWYFSSNYPFSH